MAARTGLPRPTVSRLTRSLVDAGFLAYDLRLKSYRLTAVFLSLAQAYRQELPVLDTALSLMKKLAKAEKINIGLAVADQHHAVYLDSIRECPRFYRSVSVGSRIPIELTSLGRAILSAMETTTREELLAQIGLNYGKAWPALRAEIRRSIEAVARDGYCQASWQVGMVALAAPLVIPDDVVYALNISFAWTDGDSLPLVKRFAPMLLKLADEIRTNCELKLCAPRAK